MGCCFSRKDSKLVKLCEERKELIKDARDHQCSLAFAHMAYFQSLQEAENEFSNFMNEAIVFYHGSPSDTISDHLKEQFPPSENSSLGNSDEAKDEEVAKDDVCAKGGSNLITFFINRKLQPQCFKINSMPSLYCCGTSASYLYLLVCTLTPEVLVHWRLLNLMTHSFDSLKFHNIC